MNDPCHVITHQPGPQFDVQPSLILTYPLMSARYRNPAVKPGWYRARQRSVTPAQKRAEMKLWPALGLTFSHFQPLDLDAAFGRNAPRVLEVGCGAGEALVPLAAARPDHDFVGCDWFRSGVACALTAVDERRLANVRLVRSDVSRLLDVGLPSLPLFDEALFFFPDPWRGSPERLVLRPEVIAALSRRMRPGGCLRLATDVAGYPEQASRNLLERGWREVPCERLEQQRPGHGRPSTRYESAAIAAGRDVVDLCFVWDGGCEPGDGSVGRMHG